MSDQLCNSCLSCGRKIVKPRRGLSSVEYRRIVGGIENFTDLCDAKNKLVAIIKNVSRIRDYVEFFTSGLDDHIAAGQEENSDINIAKKWLFKQINILPDRTGEKVLYNFLRTYYPSGINEQFSIFYDNYTSALAGEDDQIMNKNFASRALGAVGLKTKIGRVDVINDGKKHIKSTMFLRATEKELDAILKEIGF